MAITRAQQAKQMLQDGGMLVKPGFGGMRQGYRGDAAYGGPDKGDGPASGGDAIGDLTREQFMGTKGKTRTGLETNKGGQTINTPPQTSVFTDVFNTGLKNIKNIFGGPVTLDDVVKTKTLEDDDDDVEYPTSGYDTKLDQKMKAEIFGEFANMKAEGGRIGYALGAGADMGKEKGPETGRPGRDDKEQYGAKGQYQGRKGPKDKDKDESGLEKLKTTLQKNAIRNLLNTPLTKQKGIIGQIKASLKPGVRTAQDYVDLYSDPNLDQIGLTANELTRTGELIDALGTIEKTGSLDQDKFEDVFFGGKTNPVTETDPVKGGISPIIPVDTTFAKAPVEEEDYYGGRNPFDINRIAYRLMADGGAVIDDEPRQAYGLGSIVKKATRAVKKVAKSPVGKALLAYGAYKLGGLKFGESDMSLFQRFSELSGPQKALLGIGATSALAGFMTPKEEEEDEEDFRGEGLDIPLYRRNPQGFLAPRFMAEGGSTEEKEPVAKKVMPLIDMDGMEKDYRETGGFVEMGRMEKADDVPARLSKNEFVFTADAVRNAGDGSVDKGAEVMYNMMKNLEAGGEVSEESQGLEGARKMFQTSQRLEEVL